MWIDVDVESPTECFLYRAWANDAVTVIGAHAFASSGCQLKRSGSAKPPLLLLLSPPVHIEQRSWYLLFWPQGCFWGFFETSLAIRTESLTK